MLVSVMQLTEDYEHINYALWTVQVKYYQQDLKADHMQAQNLLDSNLF